MNSILTTLTGHLPLIPQPRTHRRPETLGIATAVAGEACHRPGRGILATFAIPQFAGKGCTFVAGLLKGAISTCLYGIFYAFRLPGSNSPGNIAFLPDPWSFCSRRGWLLPTLLLCLLCLGGVQPASASQQSNGQMLVSARVVYHCRVRTSVSSGHKAGVRVTVRNCPSEPRFRGNAFSNAQGKQLAVMARQYTLKRVREHSSSGVEYLAIDF